MPASEPQLIPILPVEAYTSRAWYDREQERIFSRTWAYAGFGNDITAPGQYLSVQAGLNNLFVVMGRDERLRAFHNICRHRGTQLIRPAGRTAAVLRCPYHDWTYNLEGELVGCPDAARSSPTSTRRVSACFPRRSASGAGCCGCIRNRTHRRVKEWFGAVEPDLGPHRVDELVEWKQFRTEQIVEANWKIVVENFIDGYHLKHLHSGTLAMYDHDRIESRWHGPHFTFWEPLSADYAKGSRAAVVAATHRPHSAGAARRVGADVVSRDRVGGDREHLVRVSRHAARVRANAGRDAHQGSGCLYLGIRGADADVRLAVVQTARQVRGGSCEGPARLR